MNTARRSLAYVRQYVIVAIYEVLEQLCAPYEKTDASTILSEIPVYGNKSVFQRLEIRFAFAALIHINAAFRYADLLGKIVLGQPL